MPSSRTISANGIEMFLLEQGEGPLVVLCHGWPELSYSWRHQIPAIAAAGFHVVAPDMRGFGRTSAPADIGAYTIFDTSAIWWRWSPRLAKSKPSSSAMTGVRRSPGMRRLFRPDIFSAVAGLSVPPPFRGRGRPLDTLREKRHHQFLLAIFPDARRRRSRVRARHRADDADRARARIFRSRASLFVEDGKGFLGDASPPAAAGLADRGRPRLFYGGLPEIRLPRRAQLVSQHRPQLGTDRAMARRANRSAVPVHRGIEGCRHHRPDRRQTRRRHGAGAAEPETEADHRWRRPLDPAGARRRGQRGLDRFSARSASSRFGRRAQ